MSLVFIALIGVLIIFMFRNGKKRKEQMEQLQSNMQPGAEVMLQSGIYGTVESINDEDNRVTLLSGTSTLVVHRNAISQVVTPVDAPADADGELAPDDDPEFGQRIGENSVVASSDADVTSADVAEADATDTDAEAPAEDDANAATEGDESRGGDSPKA